MYGIKDTWTGKTGTTITTAMLNLKRFGPHHDFSGRVIVYPVQWCAHMPIGSVASRREIKLRLLFARLQAALGHQWSHGVACDSETHVHYEELHAYTAHWADEDASLMENSTLVIDLADMSDRMRDLLVQFDPLWVDDREFQSRRVATLVNRRSDAEKQAASAERAALLAELDAFDREIGV